MGQRRRYACLFRGNTRRGCDLDHWSGRLGDVTGANRKQPTAYADLVSAGSRADDE
ncbi:hypothetical protein [Nocardioides yefusunii]|uniref:Uncharacterized protein n=1 Tax=Nocardioides yefusunii TaxID=2500546 RepID=A0ABW1QY45_9ACTN|nr:hypothetical protein [Nocardioides yefusunii]